MKKTLTVVGGLLLALSAGAGVASASVSAQQVQQMISDQLAQQTGLSPDSVVCPGELATEVGASVTCQATAGGETHPITVTVASADNGQLGITLQVTG